MQSFKSAKNKCELKGLDCLSRICIRRQTFQIKQMKWIFSSKITQKKNLYDLNIIVLAQIFINNNIIEKQDKHVIQFTSDSDNRLRKQR